MKVPPLHSLVFWFVVSVVMGFPMGLLRAVDGNSNNMSDVWEAAYGEGLDPLGDRDGDGKTNLDESRAGTDPSDPESVHHVQTVSSDGESVALAWPSVTGKKYQVEVSSTLDGADWIGVGPIMSGDGMRMEVDLPWDTTFATGGVLRSVWRELAEDQRFQVGVIAGFASTGTPVPTETGKLTRLDAPRDEDDFYGQWVRGWIIPPVSGEYTFYLASDDGGALRISTSADPAEVVIRSTVPGWTGYQEWTKYGEQTSAPIPMVANQAYYFEAFMTEGGGGDHLSVAWSGPGRDREIIDGRYLATDGRTLADMGDAAKLFFRVVALDEDTDADGLTDYEENLARLDPTTATTVPRVQDLDTLLGVLAAPNMVTIGASRARGYEDGPVAAKFTISRSGGMEPLVVGYSVAGTALEGVDYQSLTGTARLGPAENQVEVVIEPLADAVVEPAETVTLTVLPGSGYQLGSPAISTVTIDDAEDVLYVATLRGSTASGETSGGFGYASIRVAGNQVFGTVSLQFSNLNASQTGAEIYLEAAGTPVVLTLAAGQINGQRWEFEPSGGVTTAEILAALASNQLALRVLSDVFPEGEISGIFRESSGWQIMPVPPAVPTPPETLPAAEVTAEQAARFLTQATFGPTEASIAELQTKGIDTWLNEQLAMAPSLHLPDVQARRQQWITRTEGVSDGWQGPRHETWWQRAITAPDQLRQRMAFALSEIFVISEFGVLDGSHEGVTNWYDMLLQDGFGNYRDLLEKVTLSPIMGQYLSMVRNRKPDPATGSEPDENYAREVMQLFSIGLSQLHLDGSLKLNAEGMPTPTYTQDDIVGLAHVFTGWSYGYTGSTAPNFFWGPRDEMVPMVQYPDYHDTGEKHLINGVVIPAGQTGEDDMAQALDLLASHPNVAPFISRQLIQRFVTSNPSPGYIHRVATVFRNSDGNLGQTLRAVLTDFEARDASMLASRTFGKQREPVIRFAHLLRTMNARPPIEGDPSYYLSMKYTLTHQGPLASPSVFNFFQPGYIPPGPLSQAGLYAPEFQITSETTTIMQANAEFVLMNWGMWVVEKGPGGESVNIYLDPTTELLILQQTGVPFADNENELLDLLNLKLLSGQMSAQLRAEIHSGWDLLPSWFNTTAENYLKGRIEMALYLIFQSPEYAIQK